MSWIIANIKDPELCWSNFSGWVTETYDTFTDEERWGALADRLPLEGVWEWVPWSIEEPRR